MTAQERLRSAPAPVGGCTNPRFTTDDVQGGWETAGFFVYNNVWNASEAGPQTLTACSYRNWQVISNQRNLPSNPGSVKSYPNVHKDFRNRTIASFSQVSSRFSSTAPGTGIYNVAYDLWLDGLAQPGSTEVMIWTENVRQRPLGSKVATVTFDGVSYAVWRSPEHRYFAFVAERRLRSATLDLLAMLRYLTKQGWVSSGSTLDQIGYGIEFVDTKGQDARFAVTDFAITAR